MPLRPHQTWCLMSWQYQTTASTLPLNHHVQIESKNCNGASTLQEESTFHRALICTYRALYKCSGDRIWYLSWAVLQLLASAHPAAYSCCWTWKGWLLTLTRQNRKPSTWRLEQAWLVRTAWTKALQAE